jgi:signal transduction histidine kinase
MRELAISTPENIERYNQSQLLPINTISGALLFLMVFYTVDFLLHRRREALYFAISCFLLTIRSQRFYFQLVPYEYNWEFAFRLLFAGMALMPPVFVLLADSLYPGRFKKIVIRILNGLTAAVILAYIFLPTRISSGYLSIYLILVSPLILYFLVRLPGVLRGGAAQDRLAVSGLFVLLLTALLEMPLHQVLSPVARGGLMPAGMLVFAVCYMMMLRLRAEQAAIRLTEAQRKTDFYYRMAHDLLTPLTIVSSSIQVVKVAPEDAEMLKDSQAEIMKMAGMINEALRGGEEE